MATANAGSPACYWQRVFARHAGSDSGFYGWDQTRGGQPLTAGDAPPLPVQIGVGDTLGACVIVQGGPPLGSGYWAFTGDTTAGSPSITNIPDVTGLQFGQFVVPVSPAATIPNDCQLLSVTSGPPNSIEVGGDNPAPALQSSTGASFQAVELEPHGYLVVTVSPTTGVTITDDGFDGTLNAGNVGNGQMVSNYSAEPEGNFFVNFADAGTFTIAVAFASTDAVYTGASLSPSLTVKVS